ncbi:unnamed protein product [Arctia plantaginis]|uniref:Uncharacterized protein n=1 Tax=Arctia plantaginis TaxID=874455 RepID=A0A8S1B5G9_ARCPL|nr:unnamed protein product [Arctia plantaginis]
MQIYKEYIVYWRKHFKRYLKSYIPQKKNRRDKIGNEARNLIETRTNRKQLRSRTIKYHIERSGGLKKALKELKENTAWIPSIKSKTSGKKETKRPKIIEIATTFYSDLYDDDGYTNTQYQNYPPDIRNRDKKCNIVPKKLQSSWR